MIYTIVKTFKFSCAHRLMLHSGLCGNVHGHNYKVKVHVSTERLNSNGMVMDFSDLKKAIGVWIDQNWDHALLFNTFDKELNQKIYRRVFAFDCDPTAEVMADMLLNMICPIHLPTGVICTKIQLWETDDSYVEVTNA